MNAEHFQKVAGVNFNDGSGPVEPGVVYQNVDSALAFYFFYGLFKGVNIG